MKIVIPSGIPPAQAWGSSWRPGDHGVALFFEMWVVNFSIENYKSMPFVCDVLIYVRCVFVLHLLVILGSFRRPGDHFGGRGAHFWEPWGSLLEPWGSLLEPPKLLLGRWGALLVPKRHKLAPSGPQVDPSWSRMVPKWSKMEPKSSPSGAFWLPKSCFFLIFFRHDFRLDFASIFDRF